MEVQFLLRVRACADFCVASGRSQVLGGKISCGSALSSDACPGLAQWKRKIAAVRAWWRICARRNGCLAGFYLFLNERWLGQSEMPLT
jgi:hypothetical protein